MRGNILIPYGPLDTGGGPYSPNKIHNELID